MPGGPLGIPLSDGRTLGYEEFGRPDGQPVLYFHGFPGSRLDYLISDPDGAAAAEVGARIIAVDRPGMGRSSFLPDRRIVDWPRDVAQLADALALRRFAVVGVSGGGPYAAACAHALPERIDAAAIVCGMGPADAPGATEGVSWTLPGKNGVMRWVLLSLMAMGLRRDPDQFVENSKPLLAEPDRRLLDDRAVAAAFVAGQLEAFHGGTRGARYEARLYRDWGFDPADVTAPVQLWHGGVDANVPVTVARHMAERLPDCRATFLEDEAHLTLARNHMREILAQLLDGTAAVG